MDYQSNKIWKKKKKIECMVWKKLEPLFKT